MLTRSPYVLAVYPGLGVRTLEGFIAKAKAEKLSYTAANRGGLGNIGGEYFQHLAHITMQHVPYRGGGPAVSDAIAGHVPAIFLPVSTLGEHIRIGALTALAISSPERVAALPDVPTFTEQGYPDLVLFSWFGLSAPEEFRSGDRRPYQPGSARLPRRAADEEARGERCRRRRSTPIPQGSPATSPPRSRAGARWSARSTLLARNRAAVGSARPRAALGPPCPSAIRCVPNLRTPSTSHA